MLESDRVVEVQQEALRWQALWQFGLKDGNADVGAECEGAEFLTIVVERIILA